VIPITIQEPRQLMLSLNNAYTNEN